jgi:hypothetical protein
VEPSIKGAAIVGTVERLRTLLDSDALSRHEIETRLSPEALRLIEQDVEPSLWYPVKPVAEIGELLMHAIGADSYDFMVRIGEGTAERFQKEGIFKAFIDSAAKHGDRVGQVVVRISELGFSFGDWTFEGNMLDEFTVTVRNAEPLPEPTRFSVLGFTQGLASSLAQVPIKVVSERPEPGTIIYRGYRIR